MARLDSCRVDHCGQPSGLIVAERLQAFKLHVAAPQLPLVVLLEQQRADEAEDRGGAGFLDTGISNGMDAPAWHGIKCAKVEVSSDHLNQQERPR